MTELLRKDLAWCVNKLPATVRKLMKENPDLICAGGYIRDRVGCTKPSDIDLFAPNAEKAELWAMKLCKEGEKPYKSQNAFTIKSPITIQIIHRWTYESAEQIIPSFDFTIAMAAIWYDGKWMSKIHDTFYADLAGKRLVYTSPQRNEDAGGSMLRVLKFYQRDYRIPLDSLAAVISRLVQGVERIERLNEPELAKILSGLLREVDPSIDPEHFFHLPLELDEEHLSSND